MSDPVATLGSALADRYRLDRELGRGGMATVYLAQDLRHHRKVAIKVLHPELSAILGPDRFLKEIELTANLQHPHILPLFDSGEVNGLLYYVMPYVEGETLRRRLDRERQLPIADALRIAAEAADALEYAHRHGVVHRDIKPENILLHDRRPLLADFGIALAVQEAGGIRMTQTGMSLGTPQYMAPEQAMGDRAVDHRADIYALGAVTYEMLAGEPPFTGPSSQAIVAKVMTEKPRPLEILRDTVPPHVAETVHGALQKLPADRPATAAIFAEGLREQRVTVRPSTRGPARGRLRHLVAPLIVGAAALVLGYVLGGGRTTSVAAPPSRLALLPPTLGGTGVSSTFRQLAITPDGSAIVFSSISGASENELALQRLEATDAAPISGSRGLLAPEISADGRFVFAWNAVTTGTGQQPQRAYKLSLAGGTAEMLPQGVFPGASTAAADGSLWFTVLAGGSIARLRPDGTLQLNAVPNSASLQIQDLLPGERFALAIPRQQGTGSGPLVVVDLESGARTTLIELPVVEARYTPGFVVYVQPTGSLWALPLDPKRRAATGAPVQIGTGVSIAGNGYAHFDVSGNGTVAYIPEEPRSLVFADQDGLFRPATELGRNFHAPRFSPDGRRVAVDFSSLDGRDVWILSLDQGTLSRATFDRDAHDPTWSPDGRFLFFISTRPGPLGAYRTRPGSSAPAESLFASTSLSYTGNWLPDGRGLLTTATNLEPGSATDIAIISNGGRGPFVPLVVNSFDTQYPVASPRDGRWMAYVSNQSGRQEVFVRPLDGSGADVQVSQDGGTEPVWHPSGTRLFYRSTATQPSLMRAELRLTGSEAEVLSRSVQFSLTEVLGSTPHANYDISPDGSTFVMVRRNPAERVVVIQNLPGLIEGMRARAAR